MSHLSKSCTAFSGHRLLLTGPLVEVALAAKAAAENDPSNPLLVFDDATGRVVDLDLRGSKAEIVERLAQPAERPDKSSNSDRDLAPEHRGRGRPKLGVIAREVTLLPRQWEWLAAQPGGASAVLRRLVDEAKRLGGAQQKRRTSQEAAYRFMLAIAGDFSGYEEATRALFADDRSGLEQQIAAWPEDISAYVLRLTYGPTDVANEKGQPS